MFHLISLYLTQFCSLGAVILLNRQSYFRLYISIFSCMRFVVHTLMAGFVLRAKTECWKLVIGLEIYITSMHGLLVCWIQLQVACSAFFKHFQIFKGCLGPTTAMESHWLQAVYPLCFMMLLVLQHCNAVHNKGLLWIQITWMHRLHGTKTE